MIVMSAAIQKGGQGKTSSVFHLSSWLAFHGYRTLIIDFDPQANATVAVLGSEPEISLKDAIMDGKSAGDVIQHTGTKNLDILPSDISQSKLEGYLIADADGSYKLKDIIEDEGLRTRYDFIVIDSPPSLGILTRNVLMASDFVYIPMECATFAVKGLVDLMETIQLAQKRGNETLQVLGAFINKFDRNLNIAKAIDADVKEYLGELLFNTKIRRTVKFEEAMLERKTIFTYAPSSDGAKDYDELCNEIFGRLRSLTLIPDPAKESEVVL